MYHSNFFELPPPIVFFDFLAFNWPDSQSLLLAAGRPSRMYAALPAASKVCSDDDGAYRAHAKAISLVYGSSLTPGAINPQYPSLLAIFYFLLGCCSLENRKGQQFGPCFKLSNR